METMPQSKSFKSSKDNLIFCTQHGQQIPFKFAHTIYNRISQQITLAKDHHPKIDTEIQYGDFLYQNFMHSIDPELIQLSETQNLDINYLKQIVNGIFMMRAKRDCISTGCANIFDISFKNFNAWKEFEGYGYVELKNGYGPVLDAIIRPKHIDFYARLKLSCYMKRIHLCVKLLDLGKNNDGDKNVCVHCRFSTDPSKVVIRMCDITDCEKPRDFYVVCDRVVCTMSLGYLKENLNGIFEPIGFVENERRLAVDRLGFGTINKIFLFYESPFWNEALQLIHMIWLPEDPNFQLDKLKHTNSNTRIWTEDISKIEVSTNYPNALCCWIAGSDFHESLSDETITLECTKLLQKFLDDKTIPEPVSIKRSKWKDNIFSRGSYSHIKIGGDSVDLKRLARPIPSPENPIVMFAGEHTHHEYFQSTHGAYLTGIRESNRILKIIE